jgi:hypothetical protein
VSQVFQVAIHQGATFGSLAYDCEKKSVSVYLPSEELKQKVEAFLSQPIKVNEPQGLRDFIEIEVIPTNSLKELKLALSALYNHTEVRVDWSVNGAKIPKNELPPQ